MSSVTLLLSAIPFAYAALVGFAIGFRGRWPAEILVSLLPQAALAGAILAAILFGLGRPVGGAAAAAAALAALLPARALFAPVPPAPTDAARIVWHNALGRAESLRRLAGFALARDADVVAIGEYPGADNLPAAFRSAYPHQFPPEADAGDGPVLFSRTPLSAPSRIGADRRHAVSAVASTRAGAVRVVALHAAVPWTPSMFGAQRAAAADAFAAADAGGAALLVGDFNAARWNAVVAGPLARHGRLASVPLGFRATWLAAVPFIGVPIDQAFATRDLAARASLLPPTGSDHLPVIVEIARR